MTTNGEFEMKYILIVLLFTIFIGTSIVSGATVTHKLRIHTNYSEDSLNGDLIADLASRISEDSGNAIHVEVLYSANILRRANSLETSLMNSFDCDISNIINYVGKEPGWQIAGDLTGGYNNPEDYLDWFYEHGGKETIQENLYNDLNLKMVGFWTLGEKTLGGIQPITGIEDLSDWIFRPQSKLESDIFKSVGVQTIGLNYSLLYDALSTGTVKVANFSALDLNRIDKVLELLKYIVYPGLSILPADQMSCSEKYWNELPKNYQILIEESFKKIAFSDKVLNKSLSFSLEKKLEEYGVTLNNWTLNDRQDFTMVAYKNWLKWSNKSVAAKNIFNSHMAFLKEDEQFMLVSKLVATESHSSEQIIGTFNFNNN